jgi:coenzyme PQQ precursor peptide PqqA
VSYDRLDGAGILSLDREPATLARLRNSNYPVSERAALDSRWPGTTNIAEETTMAWTTPTLVEICVGLEINGYLPAEF